MTVSLDPITRGWLDELTQLYPRCAITLSHQFLDGVDLHECGFIPKDWDGGHVYVNVKTGECDEHR